MARLLIVDDDAALRGALAEAVTDLGHEVREAPTGRIALAMIDDGGVDCVLLDLACPAWTNWRYTCRQLRRPHGDRSVAGTHDPDSAETRPSAAGLIRITKGQWIVPEASSMRGNTKASAP